MTSSKKLRLEEIKNKLLKIIIDFVNGDHLVVMDTLVSLIIGKIINYLLILSYIIYYRKSPFN